MKNEILETLNLLCNNNIIDKSTIPNIDLYIDQLVTFIEENLYSNKTNHLTKSMVNNYSKHKIIPRTDKKKYSHNHIMLLIIIYNTKSILAMSDINKLFTSIDESKLENYYNYTTSITKDFNKVFIDKTTKDFDDILNNLDFDNDKSKIALLATKLAIEANYKKMLSEMLIEKYL